MNRHKRGTKVRGADITGKTVRTRGEEIEVDAADAPPTSLPQPVYSHTPLNATS